VTDSTGLDLEFDRAPRRTVRPERAFNVSILVSAVRCTLTYVVLPFVAPVLGFAPGVAPMIGVTVGTVAIVANVYSIRRFWRSEHRLRRPVTLINLAVIGLLIVLIALDLRELLTG
jgi:multisubunit Na+/H+ antiporter MnhB subunit